jgi:ATP-binding cassette subfamily F protein 3
MAQSLIKKLNRVERIEIDMENKAVMRVRFPISVQPGKVVIEAKNVAKNYGENQVLSDVNLLIERDSKIAFVGQNGQGKSTLAKMIVNEIPFQGELKLGHNVQIGYFAQNQVEYLNGDHTVLETMEEASNDGNRVKVRDMLGAFLFGGDDVDKKVSVLSGGERNRLALCKMLLEPFNVLVMDEPTNHLDIASKNVLKQALHNFKGTLILVSHDRDFLQGLANTVYEFKDGQIKEYLGDIDYYLQEHNLENLREVEKRSKTVISKNKPSLNQNKIKRQNEKDQKKLLNKLAGLENKIANLEDEIAQIDTDLLDGKKYTELTAEANFFKNYQLKKDKIESLMREWEQMQYLLEK